MTPVNDVPSTAEVKPDVKEEPAGHRDDERDEVVEIQGTIEQTREQMSETIGELQERLSPAHIKAQIREATIGKVENMAQRASDTMYEARQSVVSTVTANPVPAALVGIGLAWLWMNRRSSGSASYEDSARRWRYRGGYERYPDEPYRRFPEEGTTPYDRDARSEASLASKASDAISGASDKISGVVGQVREAGSQFAARTKDRVSGAVDQAQQTAERVKTSAQNQAQQAQDRFNRAMDENPLAVGAIALAVGTAIGLAIPQTRKENEWMGEARDNLVDTAQAAVQKAAGQVQEAARHPAGNGGGEGDNSQPQQGGA
jgi:ElaB/YqjD/DUF883 family membrane-anchored ribosome-binding protein